MSKSIKLKNDNYWDSSSVVHNKEPLSEILNNFKEEADDWENIINGFKVRKVQNNLVELSIQCVLTTDFKSGSWNQLGILPEKYRPKEGINVPVLIVNRSTAKQIIGFLEINSGGGLNLRQLDGSTMNDYGVYASIMYCTD
jgi:hypothetical protein